MVVVPAALPQPLARPASPGDTSRMESVEIPGPAFTARSKPSMEDGLRASKLESGSGQAAYLVVFATILVGGVLLLVPPSSVGDVFGIPWVDLKCQGAARAPRDGGVLAAQIRGEL